jgi:O-antigen/teichoic acid export membrane protein
MIVVKQIKRFFSTMSTKNRIVILNVLGAFAVKGLSLIVTLITTPTYLRFFNNESTLGIWFTILSVITWILNFDLGIGNGLRNHLTEAYTNNDFVESKKLISSAYCSIGALCLFVSLVFCFSFSYINWNRVFNINSDIVSANAMLKTVRIVFIGIMLQMFFKIISSVLYALQKSSINNAMSLVTSIIILISLKVLPPGDNNYNIVLMAYLHGIAVLIPYIISSAIVFSVKKDIRPSIKMISIFHSKKVLSLGGMFFIAQVLYMLIISTNEYLITLFTSSSNVVEYRLYNQLLTLGSTVFALALAPIWSAVTKAIAENDMLWVQRLYKKMLTFSSFAVILQFLMIPFMQFIFDIWLGDNTIVVNYFTASMFAVLGSLIILNSVLSSIANGTGRLKTQLTSFFIGGVVKIPLSWLIVKSLNSWVGIVIATNFSLLIYCISQPIVLQKYFKRSSFQ